MLARLLLLNNAAVSADLRKLIDDARPILLVRRVMSVAAISTALASIVGWLPIAPPATAMLFLISLSAEVQIWQVTTSRTPAALARSFVIFGVIGVMIGGAVVLITTDLRWVGGLFLALIVTANGTVLPARVLTYLTLSAGLVFALTFAGAEGGLLPHAALFDTSAAAPSQAASHLQTALVIAMMSGFILPALASLAHATGHRIRQSRREAAEATERLRAAEQLASESQQQAEKLRVEFENSAARQTRELTEQNRHLASLNAVSFVLSGRMDEEGATERALRLIARVLEVPAAELYLSPDDDGAAEYFAVSANSEDAVDTIGEAEMVRGAGLREPVVFDGTPDQGEATTADRPTFAIGPLTAKGRVVGSLAAVGERTGGWDEHSLRMLMLIGREVGIALENDWLYRRALDSATREAVLSDLARIVSGGERSRSLSQALDIVLKAADGALAALVLNGGRGRPTEVLATATGAITVELRDALERSLSTAPSLVADRAKPLIFGPNGEAPLPSSLEQVGGGNFVVVPVMVNGSTTADDPGGDVDAAWLPLIRETGAALVFATSADREWDSRSVQLLTRFSTIVARRLETDAFVRLQERRMGELAGLAKVNAAIQSTIDPARLYSGFAAAVHDLVPYEHMYIVRMDPHGTLEQVLAFGPDGRSLTPPAGDATDGGHEWLALRGTSRWVGGDSTPTFVSAADRHGLVAVMRPKGQSLGLVAIALAQPAHDQQAELLSQATEHLALALDSAALYRQATERAARLQVFGNLASTVASAVDLRDTFDDFADEMRWIVPFDRALMLLVDSESGEVEEYASCPQSPDDRKATRTVTATTPLVEVVRAGEVMTLERTDPDLEKLDWKLFGIDAQCVAAVPVVRDGATEAVFAIVRHAQTGFDAEELLALEEVAGLIAVSIDRLRLYERAEFNARHDMLTGLPNRRFLDERLADLRAGLTEDGESALLVMDMDEFKIFNDTLGHEAGDRALQLLADELAATCRSEDFVARSGGDEFVVVMEGVGRDAALALARRFTERLRDVHQQIPGAPSRLSVSIGIALAPEHGRSADALVRAADIAMYAAKADRQHRVRLAGEDGSEPSSGSLVTHGNTAAIDGLLDATRTGATDAERRALLVVERLALGTAVRLDIHPDAIVALRLLVAARGSVRIADRRAERIRKGARMMADGFNEEWRRASPSSFETGQQIATAAIELAWLTAPAPIGSGLSIDAAAERLRGAGDDDDSDAGPLNAVVAVARAQEPSQRRADHAA